MATTMTPEEILELRTLEGLAYLHVITLLQSNEDLMQVVKSVNRGSKQEEGTDIKDYRLVYPYVYAINLTSVFEESVWDLGRPSENVYDLFHFGVFAVDAISALRADAIAELARRILSPTLETEQISYNYGENGKIVYCMYKSIITATEPPYNGRRTYKVGHKFEILAQRTD